MRMILMMVAMTLILGSTAAHAGNCDYSWQRASDGSLCGGRADDARPGGRLEPSYYPYGYYR